MYATKVHNEENNRWLKASAVSELFDALAFGEGVDLVRELTGCALQLIEAEGIGAICAERWKRSAARLAHRNGHRRRALSTKPGDLEVGIPKFRRGSFFPEFLERRRRIDRALYAVVNGGYVNGVSTRAVDDLVAAMGIDTDISGPRCPAWMRWAARRILPASTRSPRPTRCSRPSSLVSFVSQRATSFAARGMPRLWRAAECTTTAR